MARMLYRAEAPADAKQKVFIAVAAYEGCGAGFTWSLFHTGAALAKAQIGYELAIYSGNCHVDDSRNRLTRDFLNSDCTDMVFLDADVGWLANDFIKLLAYDRDVVAGVYPKKHGDDTYPVKLFPGAQWSDADGLIEVEGVPTGFLRIRRQVMARLAEVSERYNAKNDQAFGTACIFERQIHNGTRWGGDYVFCKKWRALGGKIYIDPTMRFEHSGEDTWIGSAGQWLRARAGLGLKAGLAAVAQHRETVEDIVDLHTAWDNRFAASPLLLLTLARLARAPKGPILECGSGLSSLVMAAAARDVEVHALENSPVFGEHLRIEANKHGLSNLHIHCRPLVDGFYDLTGLPAAEAWRLVVIDGPPRKDGRRLAALDLIDISRATVVADDVQDDRGVAGMVAGLQRTHEVAVFSAGTDSRAFAIGAPRKAQMDEIAQSEAA